MPDPVSPAVTPAASQPAPAPAASNTRAEQIALSGRPAPVAPAPAQAPAAAKVAPTPTPAAPAAPAPASAPAAAAVKSGEGAAATPATPAPVKFDPAKHGFFSTPPETIEVVRSKYSQLEEKHKAIESNFTGLKEYLGAMGLEIGKGRDGKPVIVAGKDYMAKQASIPDIASQLSQKDLDLAASDPAKFVQQVVGKTMEALAPRRIEASNTALAPKEITEQEQTVAMAEMLAARHENDMRFPGLGDQEVLDFMDAMLSVDNEVMGDFRQLMLKSPDHYKFGMEALYNQAWRFIAPQRALAAATKTANGDETKPSAPNPSAGGVGPTPGSASADYAASRAQQIAKARG